MRREPRKTLKKKYHAIIVSHTHWDREWYLPFQKFRTRLVRLIDNLLDLLRSEPKYKSFMLDGQTVVLEDYLEIRPEKEKELRKYIKDGRILVGPWYVLADEFLTSGESLIRNLMLGHKIAGKFGGVMKVGYSPDSFGHTSQMPQILRGFGIDSMVFQRGLNDEGKPLGTEFHWKGPDGSKVLAVHLRTTYCNAANLPADRERAYERVKRLIDILAPLSSTSTVLLMNGCDHLEPQPFLTDLIEKLNQRFENVGLIQGTLTDYLREVKMKSPKLPTIRGEQRSCKYGMMLPGVISTRMYIKQESVKTQTLLERWVEPFSTFAWLLGARYPKAFLWKAWKFLLKNHPHDSICGCSIDEVCRDMLTRYRWSQQIAEEIVNQSLNLIAAKIDTENKNALFSLVIFNPLSWARTDVVKTALKLPAGTEYFMVKNSVGESVPHQVLSKKERRVEVAFLAKNVPPCGYETYEVFATSKEFRIPTTLKAGRSSLENEHLRVEVSPNGALTITDKKSGRRYTNINMFEDSGDAGDEYNYSPPLRNRVITSLGETASITLIEKGPVKATIRIDLQLSLPKELSEDRSGRSKEEVKYPVTSFVSLYPNLSWVDIKTVIDNKAKDHRLRVLIPTGITTDYSHADSCFDVIKRPLQPPEVETPKELLQVADLLWGLPPPPPGKPQKWIEDPAPTCPQQTFVDVSNGKHGITLINKGLPEYEAQKDTGGTTIALTLLRCVGWLSRPDLLTRRGDAGPSVRTPEAQCLGKHTFEYAIIPHGGDWRRAKIYQQAYQFNVSLKAIQVDKHEGELPKRLSFIYIEPDNLLISAIKKSEDRDAQIVRFYDTLGEESAAKIKTYRDPNEARAVNLNEEVICEKPFEVASNGSVSMRVEPSKIITLEFTYNRCKESH